MSESAVEGIGGDTGEVTDPQGASADVTSEEDAAAEEALAQLMKEQDPDELRKEVERWRGLAQRHEKTARDNSNAAKRLKTIEDANKTELQKAVEAQQAAEQERDTLRTSRDRMMAAAAHNLHADLIDFLPGGTGEEITAAAEKLAGIIEERAKALAEPMAKELATQIAAQMRNGGAGTGTRRPVESMRAGAAPTGSNTLATPEGLFRDLLNRRNEQ